MYNRHMGGVDLFDSFVSNYRIRIRSKKWWWPLFAWFLDATCVNAWRLFRTKPGKEATTLLDFRMGVVRYLLFRYGTRKRVSNTILPNAFGQYDNSGHWPKNQIIDAEQRSARAELGCMKCRVPLHPTCFAEYNENLE